MSTLKIIKQARNQLLVFSTLFVLQFSVGAQAALPLMANGKELPTLAPMLDGVSSAVVSIATSSTVMMQENPLLQDPFFRRFFEGMPENQRKRRSQSAGSGVIIDSDKGYIVTNHHVVGKADSIMVNLEDGREFKAKVIGSDTKTDVAVIQIKADNLNAMSLGDSDAIRVGDFVVAIGNPFGLGHTVTSGIVSALGRTGLNIEEYENFIQTDASINPGNSGGALVNLRGELVGINTAIIGRSGNLGIGFAIPVNMVKGLVNQLVEYGEIKRGQLGVYIQDLTADLAEALDLKGKTGALITEVIPGTPADKAGLESGDLITHVNTKKITNASELRTNIGLMRVDSKLYIRYIREGKEKNLTTYIKLQKERDIAAKQDKAGEELEYEFYGASLQATGNNQGVLVTGIEADSTAEKSGLLVDDIIISVNRKKVNSLSQAISAAKTSKKNVLLNIRRGQGSLFLILR